MVENALGANGGKGKGRSGAMDEGEVEELTRMAVTAIVAMVEIWMSDLWCVGREKAVRDFGADSWPALRRQRRPTATRSLHARSRSRLPTPRHSWRCRRSG